MLIQHNHLRIVRKRSRLTQLDIAFLLELSDYANVSRWEQGNRLPNIEALVAYHLLFDVPIEDLFERQKRDLAQSLCKRIALRLQSLTNQKQDRKTISRITFLNAALTKLTQSDSL
jgi:transcriptional regulator with XRE-family HTH domain